MIRIDAIWLATDVLTQKASGLTELLPHNWMPASKV